VRLAPALSALRLTIDTPTEKLLSSASLFQNSAPVPGPSRTEPAPAKERKPERPSRPMRPVYEKSPWTTLI
jgi:hypothetical protein